MRVFFAPVAEGIGHRTRCIWENDEVSLLDGLGRFLLFTPALLLFALNTAIRLWQRPPSCMFGFGYGTRQPYSHFAQQCRPRRWVWCTLQFSNHRTRLVGQF